MTSHDHHAVAARTHRTLIITPAAEHVATALIGSILQSVRVYVMR